MESDYKEQFTFEQMQSYDRRNKNIILQNLKSMFIDNIKNLYSQGINAAEKLDKVLGGKYIKRLKNDKNVDAKQYTKELEKILNR